VKLCKNGNWTEVTVDDYFPCTLNGGPIFSRSNGDELWVLLLEKAYAKLHGSYFALRGGFANEGMLDLTGCPTEAIELEHEHSLFAVIKGYDQEGYLISASTAGEDKYTEDTDAKPEEGGLIPGHAYSIIQVKENEGNQLLNMRNPWGTFEWEGDWADSDKAHWTASMVAALNPVFGDDGTFWMSFADFARHFKTLNVCKVSDWEEVRVKGEFRSGGASRYFYELSVTDARQRVVVGLHQEDDRIQGVGLRKPYLNCALMVMKRTANHELHRVQEFKGERQLEAEMDLERGEYVIVPRATGCLMGKIPGSPPESITRLVNGSGELHPLVEVAVRDLFRRLDKVIINNSLDFPEFEEFY
jgi:calpain-15